MTLFLFAGLAFLFPIAVYCLLLALVNAREHPTLVSGPWDFAGALFGVSGFLVVGGPCILAGLHGRWREHIVHGGKIADLVGFSSEWGHLWKLAWLIYFGLVIGGAALLLWRRRRFSVVYNIDPAVLDEALAVVCGRLKLEMARMANRIQIGAAAPQAAGALREAVRVAYPLGDGVADAGSQAGASLALDPFPAMRNVTLAWDEIDTPVRRDVEAELGKVLLEVPAPDNPSAGWFLTIATCLFGAIFLGLIAFILFQVRR